MQTETTFHLKSTDSFAPEYLHKGVVLVLLHAKRIPPHVGLIIDKTYQSLTIKGRELNVPVDALLRTISQKEKEVVFIKIKKHPTFSDNYLKEYFTANILQYKKVEEGGATCLHPIRSFFEEAYLINTDGVNYVFDLIHELQKNGKIEGVCFNNIPEKFVELPVYTKDDIYEGIRKANIEAEEIKNKIKGEVK